MKLTKNFTVNEFTCSVTAAANGFDNRPSVPVINNLKALCEHVLQPLREHLNCPIIITSGYRCQKLNEKVGGTWNSQHLKGEAADFICPGKNLKDIFAWMRGNLQFDQLLYEFNAKDVWIHVSYRINGKNRLQAIDNYKA